MSEITLKIKLPEHFETFLQKLLNNNQATPIPPANDPNEIWNVDEVCAAFKIPKTKLYSLTMQTGEAAIPRFKIGRDLRFKKSEVIGWFNQQRDLVGKSRSE